MTTRPRPKTSTAARDRLTFGRLRQRTSGRWQAGYPSPRSGEVVYAPDTFATRNDARAWLEDERELINSPNWVAPKDRLAAALAAQPPPLARYAENWLAHRTTKDGAPLKPRTVQQYTFHLDRTILPALGDLRLDQITATTVGNWFNGLTIGKRQRAQAYGLLRAIMNTAVAEEYVDKNPCRVRGGGSVKKKTTPKPATLAELEIIVDAMPDRLQLAVLIAAWCGLRQGELFELRRKDIDLVRKEIHVERAVTWLTGQGPQVGDPKNEAGIRRVAIPPHLLPVFKQHLAEHVERGREALLFTGRDSGIQVYPSTLYRWFYPAREAAGRPDLRWHDLRHTGATLAAATGATLAELMNRIGHSTYQAAMIYQHASSDRDQVIAEALSRLATVTPIRPELEDADLG